ncbi:hypothetical protein HKK80_06175 [Halonotius sp. F2-221B]|uniref:hypothetical protein n=1 Tax=Halonotius sp. F2-221B TaxID=2731620 RepID=UPI00398A69AF
MGVESVREASVTASLEAPQSEESDELYIELQPPESPSTFERLDDYPFSTQDVIRGHYRYESSPRIGSSEIGEGEFQLRTESGLAILRTESDRPRPKKIFEAIDQVINSDSDISREFVPNQEQAWDFVERADSLLEVKVITPSGRVESANQLDVDWEELRDRYHIELAQMEFDHEDGISVRYNDDTLKIEPDNPEAREYVIQNFEIVMTD